MGAVLAYGQWVLRPQLQEQQKLVQAEAENLKKRTPVSTLKPAELEQAWEKAQQVAVQLKLSWPLFFSSLAEATRSGDVAFVSIEPDPAKRIVVFMAEARNMDAMLHFVSELQANSNFSDVVLQSHVVNTITPERPVRFRVSAVWRAAS